MAEAVKAHVMGPSSVGTTALFSINTNPLRELTAHTVQVLLIEPADDDAEEVEQKTF